MIYLTFHKIRKYVHGLPLSLCTFLYISLRVTLKNCHDRVMHDKSPLSNYFVIYMTHKNGTGWFLDGIRPSCDLIMGRFKPHRN